LCEGRAQRSGDVLCDALSLLCEASLLLCDAGPMLCDAGPMLCRCRPSALCSCRGRDVQLAVALVVEPGGDGDSVICVFVRLVGIVFWVWGCLRVRYWGRGRLARVAGMAGFAGLVGHVNVRTRLEHVREGAVIYNDGRFERSSEMRQILEKGGELSGGKSAG
jgi:hypothetical protein